MLAYHPFAISVASKSVRLRDGRTAYRSYLTDLRANTAKALDISTGLSGALPNGYEGNIVANLILIFGEISPQARELMSVGSAFA